MYVCHLIGDIVLQLNLKGRNGIINTNNQQVRQGLHCEDSGAFVCTVKAMHGKDYQNDAYKVLVNISNVCLAICVISPT